MAKVKVGKFKHLSEIKNTWWVDCLICPSGRGWAYKDSWVEAFAWAWEHAREHRVHIMADVERRLERADCHEGCCDD